MTWENVCYRIQNVALIFVFVAGKLGAITFSIRLKFMYITWNFGTYYFPMMKCIMPTSSGASIVVSITDTKSNIQQRRNNDTEIQKNKIMEQTWKFLLKWVEPVFISRECRNKDLFFHVILIIKYHLLKSMHNKAYHTGNKNYKSHQQCNFFIFIRSLFAITPSIGNAIFFFVGGNWFPEKLVTNYSL
jgi:hypothetical protein